MVCDPAGDLGNGSTETIMFEFFGTPSQMMISPVSPAGLVDPTSGITMKRRNGMFLLSLFAVDCIAESTVDCRLVRKPRRTGNRWTTISLVRVFGSVFLSSVTTFFAFSSLIDCAPAVKSCAGKVVLVIHSLSPFSFSTEVNRMLVPAFINKPVCHGSRSVQGSRSPWLKYGNLLPKMITLFPS